MVQEDLPRKKLQGWVVTAAARSQARGGLRLGAAGTCTERRGVETAGEQVVRNEPGGSVRGGF